jgi:pimeloyl-ACP methyl ester carboxylesterase
MSGLSRSLAAAIVAYVLIVLVLVGCQRSFLYFPDKTALEAGQTGVQVVKLLSEPDLELVHLYRPPRAPDGPVVVVFHGNAGHAGHRAPKFRALLNAGFGVFFVEYRGYGGNLGRPDETGLTVDARTVMAHFQSEGVDPGRIVLYGESLGAGLAVKMAAEHPVAGVVLEAPYTSIADVAQAHYWFLPARWLVVDRWDIAARIGKVNSPVLVVHGETDQVIPVRFGKRVFELASEPKAALFQSQAGHNNLFEYPEVVERVIAFVWDQVPDPAADPTGAHNAAN